MGATGLLAGILLLAISAGLLGCTDETPTAEDLRDRAVAWVRQGTTEARAEAGSDGIEMVWTYAPGGLPSQWDVTPLPREPALPPPIVWDGEAYYLDLKDFNIQGVNYRGWLRVSPAALRQGIESADSETARMAQDLTRILSFLRAQDPLRVISTFRPDAGQSLNAGEDGLITLRGKAVVDEVLGPEWPTEPLVELRQEGVLPLEFPVELVLEGSDGSIAELRVELGQAASVLNWKRVDTAPVVPGEVRGLQEFLAGA